MRGRRGATLTIGDIAEYVAFEAGKTAEQVLQSKRAYDLWLRRLAVWLARDVGRQTVREMALQLGHGESTTWFDMRRAELLHVADAEFRLQAAIITQALVAL